MNNDNKLGRNLRYLRNAHGETLETLGGIINMGKSAIGNYENGRNIRIDTLQKIADHFMVTISDLISCDYSKIGDYDINPNFLWDNIFHIFPMFTSAKAKQNIRFHTAYSSHTKLFALLKQNGFKSFSEDLLNQSFCEYQLTKDDNSVGNISLINALGLKLLVLLFFVTVPQFFISDEEGGLVDNVLVTRLRKENPALSSQLTGLQESDFDDTRNGA